MGELTPNESNVERDFEIRNAELELKRRDVVVHEKEMKSQQLVRWVTLGTAVLAILVSVLNFKAMTNANKTNQKSIDAKIKSDLAAINAQLQMAKDKIENDRRLAERQSTDNLDLAKRRAKVDLISAAGNTGGNKERAIDNLRFYLNVGLLEDQDHKIRRWIDAGKTPPISILSPYSNVSDPIVFKKVVDATGAPVANATISCGDPVSANTTTDADGEFSCELPPKTKSIIVEVKAPGYYTYHDYIDHASSATIRLRSKPK